MASGPGGEIYIEPEISAPHSLLDVLYANHFEGQAFDPEHFAQTEEKLYRGAPPEWLNFHISEQAESNGLGTPFIKRDGYNTLRQQICQRRKHPGISTVKLFHQPGCGGTTLAMQVLWDLQKTFRCAVLTDSTANITDVAKEVVHLFTAGGGDQKTVLLLLNEEHMLENLQNSIMMTIAEQKVVARMPVAILLSCVRKDQVLQSEHVALKRELSDTEMQKFNAKKEELQRRFGDRCKQFHGFNIMQTNFSQDYIRQACAVFSKVKKANRPRKTQLAGFLALLNAYVPGSYLLESQCLDFLTHNGNLSLEDLMQPFSHLIVIFQQNTERRVRIVHPMIAQAGTELMAEKGVTRSDTARNLLNSLCKGDVPPCLQGFVKDMLTKREIKKEERPFDSAEIEENQEKFSRLILDIQRMEDHLQENESRVRKSSQSASVLKVASKRFDKNPFFPQALARVYYIKLKNYNKAEMWANKAKERDPQNSFVADTLGQVHKNHLKNTGHRATEREILQLARKAIKAFKHEEQLAEKECDPDMKGDGMAKVSHVFNTRGQFGFLQVCNILYNCLIGQNKTWEIVLKKKVPMCSVLTSLGDNKLYRFNALINSLRDDVKKKCDFLNAFLTYSKPGMQKEDKPYILTDVSLCYNKYIEQPLPDLVMEILKKFEDDVEDNVSLTDADTPENYIVALLKAWSQDNFVQLIEKVNNAYKCEYANYYRSRYLHPLFYLGGGETVSRIVPRLIREILPDEKADFINCMMSKDKIFRDLRVQENLTKFHGVIQNYSIVANVGGEEIEVKANMQDSLWIPRDVSFYLGFNISGLVAFGIQTKPKNGSQRNCSSCGSDEDSCKWTAVIPRTTQHDAQTYSLQSKAGNFQCNVSALRWVCKDKVSFTYQFTSWENHRQTLDMVHCKPGGPLLDITVTDGKLDEVYLPHWMCTDVVFAVLHEGTHGNFLEQVSEVKDTHVKLHHPSFSTHGVLIRAGFPIKVHCHVLIYRTSKRPLKLYVYLIPRNPAIQQAVERMERTRGSKMIPQTHPKKALQMQDSFILKTDANTAAISPAQITLQEEGGGLPTCFEVIITNANSNLMLTLVRENEAIWNCTVSRDDYKN